MNGNICAIKRLLLEIGVSPDLVGYHYLTEAVNITLEMQLTEKICYNNTIKLYCDIAKKYNTTKSSVERAIRHSIEKAFSSNNERLYNVFNSLINIDSGKVTNSCFIHTLVEYLIIEEL